MEKTLKGLACHVLHHNVKLNYQLHFLENNAITYNLYMLFLL